MFDLHPLDREKLCANCATIEKARRMLGFDPKTQLNKGLRNTWQWFTSHDRSGALKLTIREFKHSYRLITPRTEDQ
jgi:dTDP-D-glucose 4,6-dehydratase